MYYHVIRIRYTTDGTRTPSVYETETEATGYARYYTNLAQDYGSATLEKSIHMLFNGAGRILASSVAPGAETSTGTDEVTIDGQ